MSHYMYTYETLLGIVIQHPDTVPLKDNVRFVASEETTQILSKYGLIMKPTNTGFVITYKTSTTFNETKDTEGNVVFTPSGSINWLDIPTLDISLEFFCIANKKFIKNTDWEELGPREKKENEVTVIYSYNRYSALYDAPASAPDIDNAPTLTAYKLEHNDYNRLQVAKISFQLTGHIPTSSNKINTIII